MKKYRLMTGRAVAAVLSAAILFAGGTFASAAADTEQVIVSGAENSAEVGAYEENGSENFAEPGAYAAAEDTVFLDPTADPALSEDTVFLEPAEDPSLSCEDTDGTETVFRVTLTGTALPEGTYRAAVWSAEKGQDDLKWIDMTADGSGTEGKYTADIRLTDFRSAGSYYVHIYGTDSGQTVFFKDTRFTVNGVQMSAVNAGDTDQKTGTCRVVLSDVSCASGVRRIQVPVWSAPDQSDIVWYDAVSQADGSWYADVDVANHKFHTGKYHIHTYGTDGNGFMRFLGSTSVTFTPEKTTVAAEEKAGGYLLSADSLIVPDGLQTVYFAVWSQEKDQDDIRWNTGTYDPVSKTASCTIRLSDYKHFGKFHVHVYTRGNDGKMVFRGSADFTADAPSAEGIAVEYDNSTGDFTVTVSGIQNPALIRSVLVPVWSAADQSDIRWYDAVYQDNGTYVLQANIRQNKGLLGVYHCHAYMRDLKDNLSFIGGDDFTAKAEAGTIRVGEGSGERYYPLTVKDVTSPAAITSMQAAVWSKKDDQDDIKWYAMTKKGSSWTATVDIANHKTEGQYYIHVYGRTADGTSVFLGKTNDLSVNPAVTCTAAAEAEAELSFDIRLTIQTDAVVESVSVPVWCAADQSDILWYTAQKQEDGTYLASVQLKNHKYHSGRYLIHTYVKLDNGIQLFAGSASHNFEVQPFVTAEKNTEGERTIIFYPGSNSVSSVQFPTWSAVNGQDDIKWYNAEEQPDGTWRYTVSLAEHSGSGLFIVHCYADGQFAGSTEFTAEESEFTEGSAKVRRYAQAILQACNNDLYQVYVYCTTHISYQTMQIPLPYPAGYTRQQYYFTYAYETGRGNCFCYAAMFYWCAKELGEDCRLMECRYYATRKKTHDPHSWVEVYRDGVTYICDPEIGWQSKASYTYMLTYNTAHIIYLPDEPAY